MTERIEITREEHGVFLHHVKDGNVEEIGQGETLNAALTDAADRTEVEA